MKSILITGCNGGIGSALCKEFTANGWKVYGLDQQENTPILNCEYISLDLEAFVTDSAYYEQNKSKLNELDIDVLVNNAAVQKLGDLISYDRSDWRSTFAVNVEAALRLSQLFSPSLKKNKGQVWNVASIHAKLSKKEFGAYAVSKAALVALTSALARDLNGSVVVNAISPAAIDTHMLREGLGDDEDKIKALNELHPSGMIGEPSRFAVFLRGLCEQDQRFLNGANIPYDGGISNSLLDIDQWE